MFGKIIEVGETATFIDYVSGKQVSFSAKDMQNENRFALIGQDGYEYVTWYKEGVIIIEADRYHTYCKVEERKAAAKAAYEEKLKTRDVFVSDGGRKYVLDQPLDEKSRALLYFLFKNSTEKYMHNFSLNQDIGPDAISLKDTQSGYRKPTDVSKEDMEPKIFLDYDGLTVRFRMDCGFESVTRFVLPESFRESIPEEEKKYIEECRKGISQAMAYSGSSRYGGHFE